jgi:hypothetical protein
MRKFYSEVRVAAILLAVFFAPIAAYAQVPSTQPPYNVDLGSPGTSGGTPTPVITNTVRVPATFNSPQLGNLDKEGVICTFNATLSSGSPTVTFKIQNYDAASNSYYDLVTSGAQQAFSYNVPLSIVAHIGVVAGAVLPASILSGASLPVSRFWRVQEIITGANTATTSTVGCNLLK